MACIAQVRYPPPDQHGWDHWAMQHAQYHDAIERSIAQVLGIPSVTYQLYPMFKADMANWLRRHQEAHSRFCQLLSIAGQDLSNLDLKNKSQTDNWLWINFTEMLAAGQRLGTTIL